MDVTVESKEMCGFTQINKGKTIENINGIYILNGSEISTIYLTADQLYQAALEFVRKNRNQKNISEVNFRGEKGMICPTCGYNGYVKNKEFLATYEFNLFLCPVCGQIFEGSFEEPRIKIDWHDVAKLQDRLMIVEENLRRAEKDSENHIRRIADLERQMGKCLIDCHELKTHDHFHNHIEEFQKHVEDEIYARKIVEKFSPHEIFTLIGISNGLIFHPTVKFASNLEEELEKFLTKHNEKRIRVYYEVL
jgi:transcription elongation factor Elf1